MKYIRTKDGIYKTRQCYPEETLFENVTYVYRHEFVKNKDIIAKADTIEELCDEFVCIKDNKKYICWYDNDFEEQEQFVLEQDGDSRTFEKDYFDVVYGAIWTDKGLIYVAKMNDKGELELL